ncbi:MAG: putative metalloprotease CJM1_0395 family protein [Thermodesulfobacteriota bacterium]|nr:putative metalloprotease CJM1_0395 family protein [Thermodesulfobacteriota bacterium]
MLGALGQYADIDHSSGTVAPDSRDRVASSVINSESETQKSSQKNGRKVQILPGQDKTNPDGSQRDSVELSREAQEIRELQVRDREVRAHEAAHAAAGGVYAGAPTYAFKRGPDGQSYAVSGAVSIDISPIKGDPQATLQKAQQVRTAALAPAEPSAQDMRVAQKAQSMAAAARMEISQEVTQDLKSLSLDANSEKDSNTNEENFLPEDIAAAPSTKLTHGIARLSVYS